MVRISTIRTALHSVVTPVILFCLFTVDVHAEFPPTYVSDIRPKADGYTMLDSTSRGTSPKDVAFDQQGNMYILDYSLRRVIKFTPEGVESVVVPALPEGSGNGQFAGTLASAIAVDASGNIYVTDGGNNRVQKFNSSGTFVLAFGSAGSGNGQFSLPTGVATDAAGNVYVAEFDGARIQKFNSSGVFQMKFGTAGSGDGQFSALRGLAVDGSGSIYVADAGNYRIQKFNSSGVFQMKFGTAGSGDGQFSAPAGIDVDASGNMYVSDTSQSRVQKFDSAGVYITHFGTYAATGLGTLYAPYGLAINPTNGNVYVAEGRRVEVFSNTGTALTEYAPYGGRAGEFTILSGLTTDSDGNIYVLEGDTADSITIGKVWKLDSSGAVVSTFGSAGSGDGQFRTPRSIVVDTAGDIYVVDSGNNRVQKFDSSGIFQMKFGASGSGNGQFNDPYGIAVNAVGTMYVVDKGNNRVQIFDSTGQYVSQFGTFGTGNTQFSGPKGIALDSVGNVYIADVNNSKVKKFNPTGTYLQTFGGGGTENGTLYYPILPALNAYDELYVYDTQISRVHKFSTSGEPLSIVGSRGTYGSSIWSALGMSVVPSEKIYIADTQRISVFQEGERGSFPTISAITATSTRTSGTSATSTAVIKWDTHVPASSKVTYSILGQVILSDYFNYSTNFDTPETDVSTRVTQHTVTIRDLPTCTKVYFLIRSVSVVNDLATTTGSNYFTTVPCNGSSIVDSSSALASIASTSTVSLNSVTLVVPPDYATTTSEAVFQVNQVDNDAFISSAGTPVNTVQVGSTTYSMVAVADVAGTPTEISSFEKPLAVTMSYDPLTLGTTSESSLWIYRYDEPTWTALSDCTVNTSAKTVACFTDHFSDFSLFSRIAVTPTPVPAPAPSGGGGGGGGGSSSPSVTLPITASPVAQAVIAVLSQKATTTPPSPKAAAGAVKGTALKITRSLVRGSKGSDVSALQTFLASMPSVYPSGLVTGFYGAMTQEAVKKYQCEKGIVCKGSETSTGWGNVGPMTRAMMAK